MKTVPHDLRSLLAETFRESTRSWRLPVAVLLGAGLGLFEWSFTRDTVSLVFGPFAALYTLVLGPLPWRALVPLEADGERARKLVSGLVASFIALGLFAILAAAYVFMAKAGGRGIHPREITVAALLFMVGGWGLARDVQLEHRLDRSLARHGQLAAELEQARLYALRADLDPHFLFNALNAIASQCVSDPSAAEANIVRLSSLLRAVLDTRRRALHSLDDEIALARDYLGLLAARYPALRYEVDVHRTVADRPVPPLILQPLLENAVRHGKISEGPIRVRAERLEDDTLVIEVASPGRLGDARDGGIGLDLVRKRAALAWPGVDAFSIRSDGDRTLASLRAPATTATPAASVGDARRPASARSAA